MNIPASLKPGLWGAALGAGLLAFVGFNFGGWTTAGTAERTADHRASAAIVEVLAPICLSQFQLAADAMLKLEELKKISIYQRGTYVEKAGWATMPGSTSANPDVAKACADLIGKAK